jgi:hypothetical protein
MSNNIAFNWENKLSMDDCALCIKQNENESINSYNLWNFYTDAYAYADADADCAQTSRKLADFASQYPNLRYREGYGVANSCTIDADSAAKYSGLTHGPEKRQFFIRNFQAVPDLSRGCSSTDVESALLIGQDTKHIPCDIIPENNSGNL